MHWKRKMYIMFVEIKQISIIFKNQLNYEKNSIFCVHDARM